MKLKTLDITKGYFIKAINFTQQQPYPIYAKSPMLSIIKRKFIMSQKAILALIAIVLIGILGVLIYENTKKTPAEKMADSIGEAVEDVGEAFQDEAKKLKGNE